jgi:hypothetical protein
MVMNFSALAGTATSERAAAAAVANNVFLIDIEPLLTCVSELLAGHSPHEINGLKIWPGIALKEDFRLEWGQRSHQMALSPKFGRFTDIIPVTHRPPVRPAS